MIYSIDEKLVREHLGDKQEDIYDQLLTQLDEFLAAALPKSVYWEAVYHSMDQEEYDNCNFN